MTVFHSHIGNVGDGIGICTELGRSIDVSH